MSIGSGIQEARHAAQPGFGRLRLAFSARAFLGSRFGLLLLVAQALAGPGFGQTAGAELRDAVMAGDEARVGRLLSETNGGTPDLGASLRDAAYWGKPSLVKLLLDRGADPNTATPAGWTPLMAAALRGQLDIARMLVGRGASLGARHRLGSDNGFPGFVNGRRGLPVTRVETALLLAAEAGRTQIVELLAAKGADVNEILPPGRTALIAAVRNERIDTVRRLLQLGAKIETEDESGATPLLRAAESGNEAVFNELAQAGANLERANGNGETPLLLAVRSGSREIARSLLARKADPNPRAVGRPAPLLEAIGRDDLEMVGMLMAHGARLGLANAEGAFELVTTRKSPEMSALLLPAAVAAGLDTNALFAPPAYLRPAGVSVPPPKTDFTLKDALVAAARQGDAALVESILQRGAPPNQEDSFGWPPLVVAAEKGHQKVVSILLDHQANAELAGPHSWTALMEAAKNGHFEIARLLVGRGAFVWRQNRSGQTAADLALKNHHDEIAAFLEGKGAKPAPPAMLLQAAANGELDILTRLLTDKECAEFCQPFVSEALLMAARGGQAAAVKLLLRHGADINCRESHARDYADGWTPLGAVLDYKEFRGSSKGGMLSVLHSPDMVETLIAAGADVNLALPRRETALRLARAIGDLPMRERIVEQLLKAGARE